MSHNAAQTHADRAGLKEWLGLALLVLPMLTLSTDLTVLFLALPTLSTDLAPTASEGLWIIHSYGFLIAALLITMGRLGDRIGPRRLMLIGAAAFAVLSVGAAFAAIPTMLVIVRALLGVAGATLMPSLFSLLRIMFAEENQRRLAIAIMFSSFSVGGGLGPVLGGVLLEFFWWGSVFLINVPPMVLLLLIGPHLLPERAERRSASLDWSSVLLSGAGMLALVYGLQELAADQEAASGTVWLNLGISAGGLVLLSLFVRRQRRLPEPLFDLGLLRQRRMWVSLLTLLLVGIGVVGTFFLVTQHLQWVLGMTPLQAGLWTLPYIGVNIAGALLAPAMAARLPAPVVVAFGLCVTGIGAAAIAGAADPQVPLPLLILGLCVTGLGQGAAMALISDLIIASAPEDRVGSAAAAQEVGGELGTALGIAAGGAIATAVYRHSLTSAMPPTVADGTADAALGGVHQGVAAAEASASEQLLEAVHSAIGSGLQIYAGFAAAVIGLATVLFIAALVRTGSR